MTAATTFTITPKQRNALLSNDDGQQLNAAFLSIRESYEREGFVLIRGLLDEQLLGRVRRAGKALAEASKASNKFTALDFGAIFNFDSDGGVDGNAFRETALESAIPAFVAKVLLRISEEKEEEATTLRLLKDAFMAKGKEQKHCGWHVDDMGFWPCQANTSGVNSWLALDDMPSQFGGGMAVSPRSHNSDWRTKAYETIGSTPILPPSGLSMDMLANKPTLQTCDMSSLDPKLNNQIESTKMEFDYKSGDCLFCHRWLFHRSVAINDQGLKHYDDDMALKRYTIRYEKGNAKLVKGVSLEPSILLNQDNSGKTLDDVCLRDGPYYPQCYGLHSKDYQTQTLQMKSLADEKFPAAQEQKKRLFKEIHAIKTPPTEGSGGAKLLY